MFTLMHRMFLKVAVAGQSEITRMLDESAGLKDGELDSEGKGLLLRSQITHGEHPLSLGQTSVWNQFFQVILRLNMVL